MMNSSPHKRRNSRENDQDKNEMQVVKKQKEDDESSFLSSQPEVETESIPTPSIYWGTDVKGFTIPIFKGVDAFHQAWLIRILHYKFANWKYVHKNQLNACLYDKMRAKNLRVPFGIRWVWHAVWHMTEPKTEEQKQYQVVEWVYEDDFPEEFRGVPIPEGQKLPTKIKLTPFGHQIAEQLREGPRKHTPKPPPPELAENILAVSPGLSTSPLVEAVQVVQSATGLLHSATGVSYKQFEDLSKAMATFEGLLNEVALLRTQVHMQLPKYPGDVKGDDQANETEILEEQSGTIPP